MTGVLEFVAVILILAAFAYHDFNWHWSPIDRLAKRLRLR